MPKSTAALIDDATMDISEALRLLEPLLDSRELYTVQQVSKSLLKLTRAVSSLKEVPADYKTERKPA